MARPDRRGGPHREALPPDLDRWQQDDLDDFIAYLATERTNVCRTKPIPAEQYQPLMRNLWKVIDEIVPDLLTALRRTDELHNRPLLAWWGNVNQHVKSGGTSGAELVMYPGNVAPTLKTFRQVLTENPDTVFAGATDLERRSGIPAEWFSRNRERLITTGILERAHPPSGQVTRCTVPGCERERLRRTCWCRAHEYRWQQAGRPDPTSWPVTEEAGLALGPTPPQCAVPLCLGQPKAAGSAAPCAAMGRRWKARHREVGVQRRRCGTAWRLALPLDRLFPRGPDRG
jgi:hypothetical protein